MDEILLKIEGFENYRISNLGNVYNTTKKGKMYPIKGSVSDSVRISLCKNGNIKQIELGALVAKHFIENPLGLNIVKHRDGNPFNNSADNLFWTDNGKEKSTISDSLVVCECCCQKKYSTCFNEQKKICSECVYKNRKIKYGHKFTEYRNRQNFAQKTTLDGRARLMYHRCKRRSRVDKIEVDITIDYIMDLLKTGVCSKTGIKLQIDETLNNPYAPSVDRIDNSKGYTKDNIQIVCSIYNFCKNQFTDNQVVEFIKEFHKNKIENKD